MGIARRVFTAENLLRDVPDLPSKDVIDQLAQQLAARPSCSASWQPLLLVVHSVKSRQVHCISACHLGCQHASVSIAAPSSERSERPVLKARALPAQASDAAWWGVGGIDCPGAQSADVYEAHRSGGSRTLRHCTAL